MIPNQALIGAPLAKLQEDFKLVPLNVLQGYVSDTSADPSSGFIRTVVAAELARRKRVQDESNAARQPDPTTRPTVIQELASAPPPANFAHGGIIAFSKGSEEPVPSTQRPDESFEDFRRRVFEEDYARQQSANEERKQKSEEERLRLLAQKLPNLGMRRPLAPLEQALQTPAEISRMYDASWAKDVMPSAPSGQATPTKTAVPGKTPGQAGPATPGKTPGSVSTRPAATPTAPAPAASRDEGITSLADYNKKQAEELTLMGTMPKFTPEQEEAARTAAAKRLSAVQDPYMKAIADLQAKQAQIGESRGGDPFGRALMQLGLGMMKGIGRPGTGINALGEAGLGALASYEKEELGKIDRATKVNQLQIELQKELMKQGVDRVTAGNVAAKEARNIEEDRAKEIRTAAQQRATVLTNMEAANQRAAYQAGLLEAKERETDARAELRNAMAGRRMDQILLATQKLEQAQQLVAIREVDAKRKLITDEIDAITKSPSAFTQKGQQQIQQLMGELSALRGGGGSKAVTNSQFPGFSVGNP